MIDDLIFVFHVLTLAINGAAAWKKVRSGGKQQTHYRKRK